MIVAVKETLTAENAEDFAEVAEKDIFCAPLREPLCPLRLYPKKIFILLGLAMLTACQSVSSGSQPALSAGTLSEEYERSSAAVRGKYDGKEITVRGYAVIAATMTEPGADQGSVLLEEKGRKPARQVVCWFSKDQAEQFSQIKGGQYVIVKGIFNGEAGAQLKFCKLVKADQ